MAGQSHTICDYTPYVLGAATTAVVAAGITYMMASKDSVQTFKDRIDVNNQSVVIDGKPEHRASWSAKAPDYFTFDRFAPECALIYNALERGKKASNNGPCLGSRTGPNREYEWMSYQEVIDKVHQFGSAMVHKGIPASNDTFVGLYSKNRFEWTIADFGCQAFSMVPVCLYDSYGNEALTSVVNTCNVKVVVTETEELVQKLLQMKDKAPQLSTIIVMEKVSDEVKEAVKARGIELEFFSEMLEIGKANPKEPVLPKLSDIYSICPTSGTTGDPKCAIMTHDNFMFMIQSVYHHIEDTTTIGPGDYHLSYLPLAHNLDRSVHCMFFMVGASVGYFSGDIKLLGDDMATLRPTVFITVPRLLNRIYDAVQAQVKPSFLKSKLLQWGLDSKMKDVKKSIYKRNTIWDKLIFGKIQAKIGGRVRGVITGSAPLATEVIQFLRCALGCPVQEGFGQTEAGAGVSFALASDSSAGSVGPPLPGCHIKLVDVPEMEYDAKDNIGEICVKGGVVFKGYYNNKEKTAEALDEDGWLHTGDIGIWLPNGSLKIVDRKKNIFKLSQGEYIAPDKIETVYKGSPFIAQCFVDGNSLKNCIMGVVVPDPDYIAAWAKNNGFPATIEEFCQKKEAKDLILKELHQHGEKAGLNKLELVKDIFLEHNMFSVENNLLTPTLKNKRPSLRKRYAQTIIDLYTAHGL